MKSDKSVLIKTIWLFGLMIAVFAHFSFATGLRSSVPIPVPNIRWQDADKKTYSLQQSLGKPGILHFWAAWCVPCRKELPQMLRWSKENSDISVFPLSLDQRIAQSDHFIKKYKLDMMSRILHKEDRKNIKIPALPYTLFISADGKQLGQYVGMAPWENRNFTIQIRELLGLK